MTYTHVCLGRRRAHRAAHVGRARAARYAPLVRCAACGAHARGSALGIAVAIQARRRACVLCCARCDDARRPRGGHVQHAGYLAAGGFGGSDVALMAASEGVEAGPLLAATAMGAGPTYAPHFAECVFEVRAHTRARPRHVMAGRGAGAAPTAGGSRDTLRAALQAARGREAAGHRWPGAAARGGARV